MRRPLFITLVFLLLLRGLWGDAMATGMAAGHLQGKPVATEFVATHAHGESAGGHFDHEMAPGAEPLVHSAAALPDCAGHAAGPTGDAMNDACAACQACHTVALTPVTVHTPSLTIPPALVHSPAARFASALATLGQKPPIS